MQITIVDDSVKDRGVQMNESNKKACLSYEGVGMDIILGKSGKVISSEKAAY